MEDKFTFDDDDKADIKIVAADPQTIGEEEYLSLWKEFKINDKASTSSPDEDWKDPFLATKEDYESKKLFARSREIKNQLQAMFQDSSQDAKGQHEKVKK